jgi:hypothetical protein
MPKYKNQTRIWVDTLVYCGNKTGDKRNQEQTIDTFSPIPWSTVRVLHERQWDSSKETLPGSQEKEELYVCKETYLLGIIPKLLFPHCHPN